MWSLSPDIHHLNHGSFGAVPVEVQEEQQRWSRRWEEATTRFIAEDFQPALDSAREQVADFVGARPEGFAFVRNATIGVASVVRSVESWLGPGDEILTTSQAYNAVRQTLEFTAGRTGSKVVVVDVPLRVSSPDDVEDAILAAATDRTRLAVVDHISSPTGQIFPISRIVDALEPEVPVLVDGAHGPGQVPLDLEGLGASWYTGDLHKWVCAPKGSAFLSSRADRIAGTYPVVISHGWSAPGGPERYRALFDWLGTDDPSPWLAAPRAIEVVGGADPDGWNGVMARNRELAMSGWKVLSETLGIEPAYPEEMVGSMASVPLPAFSGDRPEGMLSPLGTQLLQGGFETVVMFWPDWPAQLLRVSAHLYNTFEEFEVLGRALKGLLRPS